MRFMTAILKVATIYGRASAHASAAC